MVVKHICGQNTYAVLYASNEPSQWEWERVDIKGQMDAYVYMPCYDQVEHGPIIVVSSSGGVSRIG